ncbi:MAG: hypothetical protein Q9168_004246 [Polycauliona sp. 1 TL-2023]
MIGCGILGLLGWAVTAAAQGRLGIGDQSACGSRYASQSYIGCYSDGPNGGKAGFQFRLIESPQDTKGYPGFTGTPSLSVTICTTACRAHGYKYSLLYAAVECWCSTQLPYPQPPASYDTGSGNGPYQGSSPGTPSPGSQCNFACPADNTQICGGQSVGSVYEDLSFANDTSPVSIGTAANYGYFGCYTNSNGGPGFLGIHSPSLVSCQNYCGGLGYAFAVRAGPDSPASANGQATNCFCGPEIQAGLQVDESGCNIWCANGTTTAA